MFRWAKFWVRFGLLDNRWETLKKPKTRNRGMALNTLEAIPARTHYVGRLKFNDNRSVRAGTSSHGRHGRCLDSPAHSRSIP